MDDKDKESFDEKHSHLPICEDLREFSINSFLSCKFTESCINFVIVVAMNSLTPFLVHGFDELRVNN